MNVNFAGRYALSGFGKPKADSHLYPAAPKAPLKTSIEKLQAQAEQKGVPMTVLGFEQRALVFTEQDASAQEVVDAAASRQQYADLRKAADATASQIAQLDWKESELNAKIKLARRHHDFIEILPNIEFFEGKGLGAYLKAKTRNNWLSQKLAGPVKLSAEDAQKRADLQKELAGANEAGNKAYQKLSGQVAALAESIPDADWFTPGAEFETELKHGLRNLATGQLKNLPE